MSELKITRISWKQVAAFRLSRHHLYERARPSELASVVDDMGGAQAQVVQPAQISIGARVKDTTIRDVDSAIWKDHSIVKAWGMRGTMFLLPSKEFAVFARGRTAYAYGWALSRIKSKEKLDELLDNVLDVLDEPRTRVELAAELSKSHGYGLKSQAGGGWGDKRPVPWVKVGGVSFQVRHLLRAAGVRNVICCGPNRGAEATFVRADRWIRNWKDIPKEKAERILLQKYLRAFGPATVSDFALWAGWYVRDAKPIWAKEAENMATVDVEGWKASILQSDLSELENTEVEDRAVIRLLPYFDSFLLGHKSHRNIAEEKNQKKIYRSQGWVSPVLLVDGRATGVWSHVQNKNTLEVSVSPFSKLSSNVSSQLRVEADELGRFLECSTVKLAIDS
jgi:hypothetical protein